jgi:acyl dehydratase
VSATTEGRTIKTINHYYEDLLIGDRFHSGRGRTMTETDLVVFSGLSGDYSSLHTDHDWVDNTGP